jgi:energy-coupling factor transporter ATP-binding protein EcfA2
VLLKPQYVSPWMVELHKQVVRGKHVLLYGNVADVYLVPELISEGKQDAVPKTRYLQLIPFLLDYLRHEGYEIVGQYDIADGLQLADPSMQPKFDELLVSRRGEDTSGAIEPARPSGGTALSRGSAVPPRRPPQAGTDRIAELRSAEQAFSAIGRLLSQSSTGAAFVIDFSDKLVGDPQRQTEPELRTLVRLKKALQAAAYVEGRKNVLVIVARQLGGVPPWLYQDNPLLALVEVPRPNLEERRRYINLNLVDFFQGNAMTAEQFADVVREFANLTDGLTMRDLMAIRRTSLAEQIPISRAKVLVDYYKYGRRDDPWEKLDAEVIRRASDELQKRVIGQSAAIHAIVDMLIAARVGVSMSEVTAKSGKPKGVFFFVGPTGVGKTELAKALTKLIFDDETAFMRFDMSEYAQEHAAEKLAGSPPGYVGYEEGGQLTSWIMQRPFSVVLFDEIEKAHGKVMDKFLQILEDGRLTDGKGRTAYFSQSVIIFTSNIGSKSLDLREAMREGKPLPTYDEVSEHFRNAVEQHFTQELGRPELFNRLGDNVLVFDLLRPEYIEAICQKFLTALTRSAEEKHGIRLEWPDYQIERMIHGLMLKKDNLLYGGRRIKTLMERIIERPLNRWLFLNKPERGTRVVVTAAPSGANILINGREVT